MVGAFKPEEDDDGHRLACTGARGQLSTQVRPTPYASAATIAEANVACWKRELDGSGNTR
jgi:hypothetical protein